MLEFVIINELAQDTTCTLLSTNMNSDIRPSLFGPNVQVLLRQSVGAYRTRIQH